MIRFHEGSGSAEIELLDDRYPTGDWQRFKAKTVEFLTRRGHWPAAEYLEENDFALKRATNSFSDEFCVLYLRLPMEKYVEAMDLVGDMQTRANAKAVAEAVKEVTNEYIRFVAAELDESDAPRPVPSPVLQDTSETVERALNDAERLIATEGPISAVDRAHTAFHGYLRVLATRAGIAFAEGAGVTEMYKLLRTQHPNLIQGGPNQGEVEKILKSLSSAVDALNPLRNHSSIAHPNDRLLEEPEAMLVINTVRSLLHYLNARTRT